MYISARMPHFKLITRRSVGSDSEESPKSPRRDLVVEAVVPTAYCLCGRLAQPPLQQAILKESLARVGAITPGTVFPLPGSVRSSLSRIGAGNKSLKIINRSGLGAYDPVDAISD
jgi:hypothetical protein